MNNIYLHIPLQQPDISDLVLATVTKTTGSTPQKPGSSALFNRAGLVRGTVGGGVLEGKVQKISQESVITKSPGLYHFKLDNGISGGEDALCGGEITILIDARPGDHIQVFEEIRRSVEERIPGILVTMVTGTNGEEIKITRYWITETQKPAPLKGFFHQIGSEAEKMLSLNDRAEFREVELQETGNRPSAVFFLEPVIPPPRLIIAGAGHIGKALAELGKILDFEVTVIDDRPEYANSENLPCADHIVTGDIGNTIDLTEKGKDTYIVIVTRDHKDDASALRACIGSSAEYIGMIGSRNKVARMRGEFISKGWATIQQWERVFTPVGLDIGSITVGEIAVSIAAQLVQVKNRTKAHR